MTLSILKSIFCLLTGSVLVVSVSVSANAQRRPLDAAQRAVQNLVAKGRVPFGKLLLAEVVAETLKKHSIFSEIDLAKISEAQLNSFGEFPKYGAYSVVLEMDRIRKNFKSNDMTIYLRASVDAPDILKLNEAGIYTLQDLRSKSIAYLQTLFSPDEMKSRKRKPDEKIIEFMKSFAGRTYEDDLEIAIHKSDFAAPFNADLMGVTPEVLAELGPLIKTVNDLLRRVEHFSQESFKKKMSLGFHQLKNRIRKYRLDCAAVLEKKRATRLWPNLED